MSDQQEWETAEFGDTTISDSDRLGALRTVCRNALDPADALELAQMLGLVDGSAGARIRNRNGADLHLNPGRCVRCQKSMGTRKNPGSGAVRYGGLGRCERCYQQVRRHRAKGAVS